jgi:uncharacterized membrane protein YecN with MAPEG domain
MDIVVIAIALIAALALSRSKALLVAVAGWVFGCAMVAWGPAHNSNVHLDSLGFWGPWSILLLIVVALVFGVEALKRRWARPRTA